MTSRADIDRAIAPFIRDEAARSVVNSLLGAAATVDRVIRGESTDEVKQDAAQMLLDFTSGLNSNPFWLRHSGYIMPVYTSAVMSWLHSYQYTKADAPPEDKLAFLAARNVLAEVAVAVLYCEQGTKGMVQTGAQLRQALMKLRM